MILAALVFFGYNGPARIFLGFPFVLFFPGYLLIETLYPKNEDMTRIVRIALSIGLSLSAVTLAGILLNYSPWGMKPGAIFISLLLFNSAMSVLAWRRRNSPQTVFYPQRNLFQKVKKAIPLIVFTGVFLFPAAYIVCKVPSHQAEEKYSQFYLLDSAGKNEKYPEEIPRGEKKEVILVIVNHERQDIAYRAEVRMNGQLKGTISPFTLKDGQMLKETVYLRTTKPDNTLKVEFLLFKDGDEEPCRSLYLWINVI